MTTKYLVKKLGLNKQDFDAIAQEVKNAEKETSGEIALAVTAESSSYAFWELMAAIVTSALLFTLLFPMSPKIYSWLKSAFWGIEPWHLCLFYLAVCACVTVVLYFLYNIPFLDSLIIPDAVKKHAVNARAFRQFAESGVYATENHSGILVFVSYFEKQVRIIADKGISEKISDDLWTLIADELAENLKNGNSLEGFICAVKKCGELLKENFPSNQEKNELADGLVILEGEQWV